MAVVTFEPRAVTIGPGSRSPDGTLGYLVGDGGDDSIPGCAPSVPEGRPGVQGARGRDRERRFRPPLPSPPSPGTERIPAGVHDGGGDLQRPPHEPRAHTMASEDRELRHAHQLEGGILEVTAGATCFRDSDPDGERSRTVHGLGGAR